MNPELTGMEAIKMEFREGFDLGFDLGTYTGYDIGFEEGSWAGFNYAVETIKQKGIKRDVLIAAGVILVVVPVTLIVTNLFKHLNKKSRKTVQV